MGELVEIFAGNDWGGTTTIEIRAKSDALADMVVARRDPFRKLLCEAIGIEVSTAADKDEVIKALGAMVSKMDRTLLANPR